MDLLIKKPNENDEFPTEERCLILEVLNEKDDKSQSIARATVAPGVSTALHKLNGTSEVYYMLSGEGVVELNRNTTEKVVAGDVVRIPAEMPQKITNTGEVDLVFLCFCVPAFDQRAYVDLELR